MEQTELKKKLYVIVLQALMNFPVFSIAGNLVSGLPMSCNIKWLLLFFLALLAFLYNKYRGFSPLQKFFFFWFLTGIFMPLGFINAGGSRSDAIAYSFFALIVVTFLFEGICRNILVATIIAAFAGIHVFEHFYPEKIPVYDAASRYIDRVIQVSVVMILSFLIIRRFADAYLLINKKLFRYAHYDELTGLLNRRNFNSILEKQFDSNDDKGFLIMMDVDNFKLINDKNGHLFGDGVLKRLGTILMGNFNDGRNMISRWGGDEFVVVYFGKDEQLKNALNQVKKEFKAYIDQIEPLADISIGVATLEGCKTSTDILAKADEIMYRQKNTKKERKKSGKPGRL